MINKKDKRKLRHQRVKAKVKGTSKRPRLSVFRSNQHIYVQFIDDQKETTLFGMSDFNLTLKETKGKKKSEVARILGQKSGERAKKEGIKKVVFDRGGFKYHGRTKAVAEGLREAGIQI